MATTYKSFNADTLPKRRSSRTDIESANALLAIVQKDGSASDGVLHKTRGKARNAALVAQRLLEHVAPAGQKASIRTFGVDKAGEPTADEKPAGYGFMVKLVDESADEAATEAGSESE